MYYDEMNEGVAIATLGMHRPKQRSGLATESGGVESPRS